MALWSAYGRKFWLPYRNGPRTNFLTINNVSKRWLRSELWTEVFIVISKRDDDKTELENSASLQAINATPSKLHVACSFGSTASCLACELSVRYSPTMPESLIYIQSTELIIYFTLSASELPFQIRSTSVCCYSLWEWRGGGGGLQYIQMNVSHWINNTKLLYRYMQR